MGCVAVFAMQNKFSSGENATAREFDVDSAIRNALSAAGGTASFTRAHDTRSSVRRERPGPEAARRSASSPQTPQHRAACGQAEFAWNTRKNPAQQASQET